VSRTGKAGRLEHVSRAGKAGRLEHVSRAGKAGRLQHVSRAGKVSRLQHAREAASVLTLVFGGCAAEFAIALVMLLACTPSRAAPAAVPLAGPERCHVLLKHGHNAEARTCYQALVGESSSYLKAEGYWGLGRYSEANEEFRAAVSQAADNAQYRVRWGRMLHERFNDQDAQDLFKEALARDPKNTQAYLGLALVSADGFDDGAVVWTRKALQIDPQLAEAHELLARLALEDSQPDEAAAEADAALKISADSLDAMAVHASIELLADRSPDTWFARISAINPSYGQGYALTAHHLILSGRYGDGVAYYRKALSADPQLWSARAELGVNLMRLGQDGEARQQLEKCYENGYRNDATVNSLRLLDSYKNFILLRDATTILKLHKKEADLLYPYFHAELQRSITAYEQKYKMKLPGPVQVEVYPDHEDFAVRTLGMPGLGALGVTFGDVVAMDSPSGRKPGDFHWASTLRHEMSHVFILAATNHRVPRWFTEGLAVHEETQASPEWGDPMTPDIVVALRDRKLLPVADLDRGFVRPQYPAQVIVSYFQAGQICDYIDSRWGDARLLAMVHSYAHVVSTREVIQKDLGMSTEEFDRQFQAWLYDRVHGTVGAFDEWHKRLAGLAKSAQDKQYDDVIRDGDGVIRLYPDYVYDANAYEFLAEAYLAKANKPAAASVLQAYAKVGGRRPAVLENLAHIQEELGDPQAAAATLDRINYIDPVFDADQHRHLGALWLAQKNYAGAIREYSAVLALHPLDVATAQFDLAQAYLAAGQRDKAEDAVLASLEAAPGYRPAQKLLLQLKSP
jgi:cellulose synthase operon protein C